MNWSSTLPQGLDMARNRRPALLLGIGLFASSLALADGTIVVDISAYQKALVPRNHGRVVDTSEYRNGHYPSMSQSMQFMLFYNENATSGLYVQTKDPDANLADW